MFCARDFVIVFMHFSFGLVDGVTVVNLPYQAAERPAELNKNSNFRGCLPRRTTHLSVMFHFERQEACNKEPNSGRGRTVPTTWLEHGILDPVGESFFALKGE